MKSLKTTFNAQPSLEETEGFFYSIRSGKAVAFGRFLNKYNAAVALRTEQQETPLMAAVRFGQKDFVRLLLAKGAEVDARENCGRTALMKAAMRAQRDIVDLLLENGADVEATDSEGKTALRWARDESGDEKVIASLTGWPEVQQQRRAQQEEQQRGAELEGITKSIAGGLRYPIPNKGPIKLSKSGV